MTDKDIIEEAQAKIIAKKRKSVLSSWTTLERYGFDCGFDRIENEI